MRRLGIASTALLASCSYFQRPEPQVITRTDTVTVTREVAMPLPEGDTATICLSTGMPAVVHIAANGDTLIGEQRVRMSAVTPVLAFAGAYAAQLNWFARDTLRFEKRLYRKTGMAMRRDCDELKEVGEFGGVPIFAEVTAPNPLPTIVVPVRPGVFQNYATPVPKKR